MGASLEPLSQPRLIMRYAIGINDMTLLTAITLAKISLAGAVYFAVENNSTSEIVLALLKAGGDVFHLEISDKEDVRDTVSLQ